MPRRPAQLRLWVRRLGTFQRDTVSNGIKGPARMMPAHSNMKSLHQRKTEVNHDPHPTVADHHQGVRTIRARRSSHASFGNREDATEAMTVGLVTRVSKPSLLVLPLLPGLRPMTRKDPDEGTAEVQEKAGTARQSRRDQGVPGIAAPQRGIEASLTLPKLPQQPSA